MSCLMKTGMLFNRVDVGQVLLARSMPLIPVVGKLPTTSRPLEATYYLLPTTYYYYYNNNYYNYNYNNYYYYSYSYSYSCSCCCYYYY